MPKKRTIYLASPLGFTESTEGFMETIVEILTGKGYKVINPWDFVKKSEFERVEKINDYEKRVKEFNRIDKKLAERNEEAIMDCDGVFAILDGVDVDSGTASEIGFACALGKKINGYRGDIRRSGENEGVDINLQVWHWIDKSGGQIFHSVSEIKKKFK